jgi:hypothetical protein
MKINNENYEVYLIDYIDGNLDEESQKDLDRFLTENPEIKKEFEGIEKMHLSQEEMQFPLKEKIRFTDSGFTQSEYLCVANLEGDLSKEEHQQFQNLRKKDPQVERDIKLFSHTKLKPALQIFFPNKAKLKQSVRLLPTSFWTYSAAASIVAAVIAMVFFFQPSAETTDQYSANTVKRKKVARKVQSRTKSDSKTDIVKQKIDTKENTKQFASNITTAPKANKKTNDEEFVMEFEEVSLQMEEELQVASMAVVQYIGVPAIVATPVPSLGTSIDILPLSGSVEQENKAYIEHWKKLYLEALEAQP